jgi:hypothetical protein
MRVATHKLTPTRHVTTGIVMGDKAEGIVVLYGTGLSVVCGATYGATQGNDPFDACAKAMMSAVVGGTCGLAVSFFLPIVIAPIIPCAVAYKLSRLPSDTQSKKDTC